LGKKGFCFRTDFNTVFHSQFLFTSDVKEEKVHKSKKKSFQIGTMDGVDWFSFLFFNSPTNVESRKNFIYSEQEDRMG